jgi:hypothetical protein
MADIEDRAAALAHKLFAAARKQGKSKEEAAALYCDLLERLIEQPDLLEAMEVLQAARDAAQQADDTPSQQWEYKGPPADLKEFAETQTDREIAEWRKQQEKEKH